MQRGPQWGRCREWWTVTAASNGSGEGKLATPRPYREMSPHRLQKGQGPGGKGHPKLCREPRQQGTNAEGSPLGRGQHSSDSTQKPARLQGDTDFLLQQVALGSMFWKTNNNLK